MFKKNTAVTGFGIGHFIGVADGIAVTTGTPTCKRTLDGTGGACANAAAYNTDGAVWTIDLTAGDMNADVVVLSFTLAGCIPISYTIKTVTKLVSELVDAAAAPSASDNATATAAAILVTPANKLATDASGNASANVTMQNGVAVAAADAYGNVPVDVRMWREEMPEYLIYGLVKSSTEMFSESARLDLQKIASFSIVSSSGNNLIVSSTDAIGDYLIGAVVAIEYEVAVP